MDRDPSMTTAPVAEGDPAGPAGAPSLPIEGLEASALEITMTGLVVRTPRSDGTSRERFWAYDELCDLRVASYGAVGVIRATVKATGSEVPLLLLEPHQISAARRVIELVRGRIATRSDGRSAA
jgi:hypothetical protein